MTQTRKHFFLFSFVLILVLGGIDYYINSLLKRCQVGSIAKVNAVMSHQMEAEVVVWGSSTALVHFNPQIIQKQLSLSCFNMGMDGVPFQQYSGLLEEYIEYTTSTKVLIIAVDVTGFKRRSSLYLGYNWLHHINNGFVYKSLKSIDPEIAIKSRYVPLYYLTTYDRRFLIRCFKWVHSPSRYERELDFEGFHPENLTWQAHNPIDKPSDLDTAFFDLTVDQKIVSDFKRVLELAARKNIRIAIVVPPCYSEFQKKITGLDGFEKSLESLTTPDIKIFNYLDTPISMNQQYFYNNLHLNSLGANEFSELFSNDLGVWIDNDK